MCSTFNIFIFIYIIIIIYIYNKNDVIYIIYYNKDADVYTNSCRSTNLFDQILPKYIYIIYIYMHIYI